jgi:hypothetical protein
MAASKAVVNLGGAVAEEEAEARGAVVEVHQ